jgi:hypothetical protein
MSDSLRADIHCVRRQIFNCVGFIETLAAPRPSCPSPLGTVGFPIADMASHLVIKLFCAPDLARGRLRFRDRREGAAFASFTDALPIVQPDPSSPLSHALLFGRLSRRISTSYERADDGPDSVPRAAADTSELRRLWRGTTFVRIVIVIAKSTATNESSSSQ